MSRQEAGGYIVVFGKQLTINGLQKSQKVDLFHDKK